MKNLIRIFLTFLILTSFLQANDKRMEELLKDNEEILKRSAEAVKFYTLEESQDIREITQDVLASKEIKQHLKQLILETGRRFFVFNYPSDGFQVKGYISFVPNPQKILCSFF